MMPTHGYGNMPNRKKLTHLTNHKISQKYDVGDLLHTRCRGDNSREEKSAEVRQRSRKNRQRQSRSKSGEEPTKMPQNWRVMTEEWF